MNVEPLGAILQGVFVFLYFCCASDRIFFLHKSGADILKNLRMIKKLLAIFLAILSCGLCVSYGPDDREHYEMPDYNFSKKEKNC